MAGRRVTAASTPPERATTTATAGDELFARTQVLLASLARHRRTVGNESPEERARRQRHRAEDVAHSLGSTRPGVVRAMLALVVADEMPSPKGDPPPPVAPGARVALPPKKAAKKVPTGKLQPEEPVLHNATPDPPDQLGFWE
jgi:hypothetical protein